MKIIINADDFGFNNNVNEAIVQAFKKGVISNTTIMVNMPSFDNAVTLARKYGFFDKVGLHFNIFEGKPLMNDLLKNDIFSNGKEMTSYNILHKLNKLYWFYLPKKTKKAIKEEYKLQTKKFFESGFSETHFDSHGHSHTIFSVYKAVRKNAKTFFTSSRLSRNIFLENTKLAYFYKKIINKRIRKDFSTVEYFGSAKDFIESYQKGAIPANSICEIMVHPVLNEKGRLINRNNVGFEKLQPIIKKEQLISYKDLIVNLKD